MTAALPEQVGVWLLFVGFIGQIGFGLPLIAALGLLIAGASPDSSTGHRLTAIGLWAAVTLGLPLNALLVYLRGEGPLIC